MDLNSAAEWELYKTNMRNEGYGITNSPERFPCKVSIGDLYEGPILINAFLIFEYELGFD